MPEAEPTSLQHGSASDALPLDDAGLLAEKVAFLSCAEAYPHAVHDLARRETHMSWVFLAGDRVYKLKKPVRFPYLDFSTLSRREAACRAELALNRRLAPDVYIDVVPLMWAGSHLAIGKAGQIERAVDWLIVMRRLDERQTLQHALLTRTLAVWQLDRLVERLVGFYRHADPVLASSETHLSSLSRSLAYNRRILLEPRFGLPAGLVRRIEQVQLRFFLRRAHLIAQRVRDRRVVDGHGDLRPEHIWLGEAVRIIDCLEFNARLRAVDPLDEIAFLCIECERMGVAWASAYVKRRALLGLRDGFSDQLFTFYRCYRATLRARLAIAHLLEPNPRTPQRWPQDARAYLQIAAADAARLERFLER